MNKVQFLQSEAVVNGLNAETINHKLAEAKKGEKGTFMLNVQIATLVYDATQWYNSAEGKAQREVDGITWNMYEMANAVYGKGKTQVALYRQVAKRVGLVHDYCEFVSNEQKAGEMEEYGLNGFAKYIKEEDAPQGEESAEEKATKDASVVFGEIKADWMSDGTINKKGNSDSDIINALETMLAQMKKA